MRFLAFIILFMVLQTSCDAQSWRQRSNRILHGKKLYLRNYYLDGTQDTVGLSGQYLRLIDGKIQLAPGNGLASFPLDNALQYTFVDELGMLAADSVIVRAPGQFSNDWGIHINRFLNNGLITEGDFSATSFEGGPEFPTINYGTTVTAVPDGWNIWTVIDSSSVGALRGPHLRFLSASGSFENGTLGESLIGKDLGRTEWREVGGDGRVAGRLRFIYGGKTPGNRAWGTMSFDMRDKASATASSDASTPLLQLTADLDVVLPRKTAFTSDLTSTQIQGFLVPRLDGSIAVLQRDTLLTYLNTVIGGSSGILTGPVDRNNNVGTQFFKDANSLGLYHSDANGNSSINLADSGSGQTIMQLVNTSDNFAQRYSAMFVGPFQTTIETSNPNNAYQIINDTLGIMFRGVGFNHNFEYRFPVDQPPTFVDGTPRIMAWDDNLTSSFIPLPEPQALTAGNGIDIDNGVVSLADTMNTQINRIFHGPAPFYFNSSFLEYGSTGAGPYRFTSNHLNGEIDPQSGVSSRFWFNMTQAADGASSTIELSPNITRLTATDGTGATSNQFSFQGPNMVLESDNLILVNQTGADTTITSGNLVGVYAPTGVSSQLGVASIAELRTALNIPASVTGDNLGDHTATQDLNMDSYNIDNVEVLSATDINVSNVLTSSFDIISPTIITDDIIPNSSNFLNIDVPILNFVDQRGVDTSILSTNILGLYAPKGSGSELGVISLHELREALNVSGPDNLGNHTATTDLNLNGNDIVNANTVTAIQFVGDGSGLTGISGDNLGDHSATQNIVMNGNAITGAGTIFATQFNGDGANLTNLPGDDLGNHSATTDLNMSNNKVTNLAAPTANADAATKEYVDNTVGGVGWATYVDDVATATTLNQTIPENVDSTVINLGNIVNETQLPPDLDSLFSVANNAFLIGANDLITITINFRVSSGTPDNASFDMWFEPIGTSKVLNRQTQVFFMPSGEDHYVTYTTTVAGTDPDWIANGAQLRMRAKEREMDILGDITFTITRIYKGS